MSDKNSDKNSKNTINKEPNKEPIKNNNTGPTNIGILSLIHYQFPIQAIVSILHRISGVILFIFIPIVLWAFDNSLYSHKTFHTVISAFNNGGVEFAIWFFTSMLIWHMCAGIKHLIMDLGHFETKLGSQIACYVCFIIAAALIALLGVWIW
jgi:succinate dehydrogenase / fumarate reductase, cytochrome b subunit